jgi:hypothetical protein
MRRHIFRKLLTTSHDPGVDDDESCPICAALREQDRAPDMVFEDELGETLVYSLEGDDFPAIVDAFSRTPRRQ